MNSDGSGTPRNLTKARRTTLTPPFRQMARSPSQLTGMATSRYTMNADGSNQQNRTKNPAWDAYPTFSPNGEQLTFHSNRDGSFDVFKNWGTDQTTLPRVPPHMTLLPPFSPSKEDRLPADRTGNRGSYR